jgi:hypothetical protein
MQISAGQQQISGDTKVGDFFALSDESAKIALDFPRKIAI